MARPRTIPDNRDWLRNNLSGKGFDIPLGADDYQIAKIVAAIPTNEWAQTALAWRQRKHRMECRDGGMADYYRHQSENKRLGDLWEEFIRRGFISREDAIAIAEVKAAGGNFYSSPSARYAITTILAMEADKARKQRNRQSDAATMEAIKKRAAELGVTDPVELHEKTGIDKVACCRALA